MKYTVVQGNVIVLQEPTTGMSAVVAIANTAEMAQKIVQALTLQVASDIIDGL